MLPRVPRLATLAAVAAMVLGACTGSTPSTVPSSAPSAAASVIASAAPSVAASLSPAASTAASAVASALPSLAADQLIFPGKLVICSDIPYPPQEFFDDQGNPIGSDIEIGQEIAKRLGLQPQIENAVFDTIIAAVTGGKCDIIISAQNITSDRVKQVDMIPFFSAGQSFVVQKGNPQGINTTDDLCGKSVGAETGTTEAAYITGTGDYKGQGLTQACQSKGKPAIDLKEFQKDSDALLALQGAQVAAYFADSPVAGYYTVQHADQFELAPIKPLDPALEGISVPKDKTALRTGVQAALISMIGDGTYMNILKKYGDESGAITADVAAQLNKTK